MCSLGYIPVYIDEVGNNTNTTWNYGYSKRGTRLRKLENIERSKNYTSIFAMTKDRVLGYMAFVEYVGGQDFYFYLVNLLQKSMLGVKKFFLILDNHSNHFTKCYYDLISQDIPILFLPSYRPEMMAVELLFSAVKHELRKSVKHDWFELMVNLEKIVNDITQEKLNSMEVRVFEKMRDFLNEIEVENNLNSI